MRTETISLIAVCVAFVSALSAVVTAWRVGGQLRELQKSRSAEVIRWFYARYSKEEMRVAVAWVFNNLKRHKPEDYVASQYGAEVSHSEAKRRMVSHFFNALGWMVERGQIEEAIVMNFFGSQIVQLWEVLQPFEEAMRRRSHTHGPLGFARLYERAKVWLRANPSQPLLAPPEGT